MHYTLHAFLDQELERSNDDVNIRSGSPLCGVASCATLPGRPRLPPVGKGTNELILSSVEQNKGKSGFAARCLVRALPQPVPTTRSAVRNLIPCARKAADPAARVCERSTGTLIPTNELFGDRPHVKCDLDGAISHARACGTGLRVRTRAVLLAADPRPTTSTPRAA